MPSSRLNNALWFIVYSNTGSFLGNAFLFDGFYGNHFRLGEFVVNNNPGSDIVSPSEAWAIDKKIDDGLPGDGVVVVGNRVDCSLTAAGGAITSSAPDAAKLDSIYNLASTNINCGLFFRDLF